MHHVHYRLPLALAALALLLVALEASPVGRRLRLERLVAWLLGALAAGNLLFVAYLWWQHARAPFPLELMESSILQHVQRVLGHQPLYVAPGPGFVPFAYNPLYYFAALPLVGLLGQGLLALRLTAILGALASTLIVYLAVSGRTGSRAWGLVAAGLFAAAYRAMDSYLDSAHADSLLVCSALLGTWLLDGSRSRARDWAGLLVLIAAFWFKQHGALFALGGALILTGRHGWRSAWPFWAALLLLGPVLYVFAGPPLLGPQFHFYTWDVPRSWSRLDLGTFARLLAFFGRWYAVPLAASAWLCLRRAPAGGWRWGAWEIQFAFALLSAGMGALDAESSNNVFVPLGAWAVLTGTLGLAAWAGAPGRARGPRLARLGALLAFAALAYPPHDVLLPPRTDARYAELIGFVRALPGDTYAPDLGPLPGASARLPAAHWIALDDLTRGCARDSTLVEAALVPALRPAGPAWLLTYRRLADYPCLSPLRAGYVLDTDLGDRFRALQPLLRRFRVGWPRFLYRYDPAAAARALAGGSGAGLDFATPPPHPAAP